MIGKRLKELRKEAKLTQKQLAEAVNTSQQNIAFYEQNKRKPKQEILDAIAIYLDVSPQYLKGETNDRKNNTSYDIKNILDQTASFDGQPLSEHDKEILKQVIKDYMNGELKEYDQ